MTENVGDVLERAAQTMDERGKAYGKYEDDEGHVCVIGALKIVVFGTTTPGRDVFESNSLNYFSAQRYLRNYIENMDEFREESEVLLSIVNDRDLVDMSETIRLAAKQWRQDYQTD